MLLLIFLVLAWGALHSLLATTKAKELACRHFGDKMSRTYRLGYNIFAGVSFLPVLILSAVVPDKQLYLVPLPWAGLMVIGEAAAVAMLVTGFLQTDVWEFLGFRQVINPETYHKADCTAGTRQGSLITNGLYRYVRHPLYSAGIALIWLLPLMTTNVMAINTGLTLYVIAGAIFEERKLKREFGKAYADYASKTPMLIPFIKRNKK